MLLKKTCSKIDKILVHVNCKKWNLDNAHNLVSKNFKYSDHSWNIITYIFDGQELVNKKMEKIVTTGDHYWFTLIASRLEKVLLQK